MPRLIYAYSTSSRTGALATLRAYVVPWPGWQVVNDRSTMRVYLVSSPPQSAPPWLYISKRRPSRPLLVGMITVVLPWVAAVYPQVGQSRLAGAGEVTARNSREATDLAGWAFCQGKSDSQEQLIDGFGGGRFTTPFNATPWKGKAAHVSIR